MTYHIKTYKTGFMSWTTEVTRTDSFRAPWMSIDQPKPLGYDTRPAQLLEIDLALCVSWTRNSSRRKALRVIKKDRRTETNIRNAAKEFVK